MNTQSFGDLKEGLTLNRGASLIEIFKQVFSFSIVGIFNTFLGHGTIFSLMFFFKVSPEVSNIIGYSVALVNSRQGDLRPPCTLAFSGGALTPPSTKGMLHPFGNPAIGSPQQAAGYF